MVSLEINGPYICFFASCWYIFQDDRESILLETITGSNGLNALDLSREKKLKLLSILLPTYQKAIGS